MDVASFFIGVTAIPAYIYLVWRSIRQLRNGGRIIWGANEPLVQGVARMVLWLPIVILALQPFTPQDMQTLTIHLLFIGVVSSGLAMFKIEGGI